ncbi:hypothetical protein ACIRU3_31935 [Streptomyces sp. NPDC101151]|uniref:hypothetical protein n=1 Tax=Streptomyces sp. NPDC101151 TaxID=3366115 RepID=UPI003822C711
MHTLRLPRTFSRAGATVGLTALAAAGASWVAAPSAVAQGENGDIRIHRVGVPFGVSKDDPVACRFYLDAVNFDILPNIAYIIQAQPPLPTTATMTGIIQLTGGAGHTDALGLADGQYKLTWVTGGAPREKLFRINCKDGKLDGAQGPGQIEDHQGDQHGDQQGDQHGDEHGDEHGDSAWGQGGDRGDGPKGGVHAGGGGLVDTAAAFSPVAAAAAVGLVSVCCAVYVRLIRRRPHGAA